MTRLDIRPVSPILGAEVRGVQLADGVDDDTFAAVHAAFLRHGVLLLKDQAEPMSEAIIASQGPVSAVLELYAGEAKRLGLAPGSRVENRHFAGPAKP